MKINVNNRLDDETDYLEEYYYDNIAKRVDGKKLVKVGEYWHENALFIRVANNSMKIFLAEEAARNENQRT